MGVYELLFNIIIIIALKLQIIFSHTHTPVETYVIKKLFYDCGTVIDLSCFVVWHIALYIK